MRSIIELGRVKPSNPGTCSMASCMVGAPISRPGPGASSQAVAPKGRRCAHARRGAHQQVDGGRFKDFGAVNAPRLATRWSDRLISSKVKD